MKKFIFYSFCALGVWAATSCSSEETPENPSEKASISFGAVLEGLAARSGFKQQASNLPDCSDNVPAYVEVVLSGTRQIGSTEVPLVVEINPTPSDEDKDGEPEYFTREVSELELEPGTYKLDYFAVYSSADELLWLAPMNDSQLGGFVDNPLPLSFNLGAGAKKYLDVEVLCFDNRDVNEYGYLFFDLEFTRSIEFCMYGNFCDENGRHFGAAYSASIWSGTDVSGEQLYSNVANVTGTNEQGDATASELCFDLPDTAGEDQYYLEIYMEGELIRQGVFTDADVKSLFEGEDRLESYHFREGNCNLSDEPELFDDSELVCSTIDFEDLQNPEDFNADYYADQGVQILAGPSYEGNSMMVRDGTCSARVLHSTLYPYASVLINFDSEVVSVSLVAGDYGEDADTFHVSAFSKPNADGDVVAYQTRVLAENEGGCLEFNLAADNIRSVVVFGQSSRGAAHNNTSFTDNISFCRRR